MKAHCGIAMLKSSAYARALIVYTPVYLSPLAYVQVPSALRKSFSQCPS